jgi:uncharacterized protein (UPF0335 family)
MIVNAPLLRAAALQIDDLDGQASALADQKKDIYDNIKNTIPPADFKAWKEAVKLRQKRRTKRFEMETHEQLVFDMLSMLEVQSHQPTVKTSETIVSVAAIGPPTETRPTRAGAGASFDPETGEIGAAA